MKEKKDETESVSSLAIHDSECQDDPASVVGEIDLSYEENLAILSALDLACDFYNFQKDDPGAKSLDRNYARVIVKPMRTAYKKWANVVKHCPEYCPDDIKAGNLS